jgi:poly-gamma-glutamate capsule biosynthesis protein CapA/YwtB (metallophosphatase superfamily)
VFDTRRNFLKLAAGGLALPAAPPARTRAPQAIDRLSDLRPRGSSEAVIACAGDWFLTRRLSGAVGPETETVFNVFRRADASFANLENGLSRVGSGELGGFRHGPSLRGDPALASEITWSGVRAVSLANNHTGNFGPEGLLQTMATLDAEKIAHAGAGRNADQAFAPAYVKAGDLTVAFFSAYTLYYNFGANDQATASAPGVAVCRAYDVVVQPQVGVDSSNFETPPNLVDLQNPCSQTIMAALRGDVDRLRTAIRTAADRSDFTVLSTHIHWGRHTKHDLPPNLRAFAQEMIDAGVDLFVGHGPHAIRGIELYRGKPIVHSMGNLVLMAPAPGARPQLDSPNREGLLVRATISRRAVRALEILPIAIDEKGDPRFPSDERAARTIGKLNGLSAPFGIDIRGAGWFATVPMS